MNDNDYNVYEDVGKEALHDWLDERPDPRDFDDYPDETELSEDESER